MTGQQRLYRVAYDRLLPLVLERNPELAAEKKNRRMLEGLAKEDARYALGLCTTVQLGETINARTLEGLIARCRAHALRELRELGDVLYQTVYALAPSLIKYTEPTPYLMEARKDLARAAAGLAGPKAEDAQEISRIAADPSAAASVRLLSTTPDPDTSLLAALLWAGGAGPAETCQALAARLGDEERRALVHSHLHRLGPHDSVLREYEHVDLVYELVVSASCFAQLKRHRMATLSPRPYDPALGVTIPESFRATGLEGDLRAVLGEAEACFRAIERVSPPAAAYALTNAHRRRVLFKLNARELYHLSRLREDAHAQWDIRQVSQRMLELAREKMPLTLLLAAGKDRFEERRRALFPDT